MGRLFCFDTMRTKRTFTHESTRSLEILRLDLIPLAVASVAVSHCQQIHWALDFCRDSCEPLASHTGSSCLDMHGFATKKGGHPWCGSLGRIDELTNFTPFRWFRLLPQQLSVCSSLPIGASFAVGGLLADGSIFFGEYWRSSFNPTLKITMNGSDPRDCSKIY